jgi:ABC-type multidrug transport system ATPase subunit
MVGVRAEAGGVVLLQDVDLSVEPGEIVAVVGPNGAGKTSLLRAVVGLVSRTAGRIEIDGAPLEVDRLPRTVGACIGAPAVLDWMSPRSFGRMLVESAGEGGATARVERVLEEVALDGAVRGRRFSKLSQGQRSASVIAYSLLRDPQLWLLDEPFAHLDVRHVIRLEQLISARAEAGAGVVYTCHVAGDLGIAHRAIALERGCHQGTYLSDDPGLLAWVR